MQYRKIWWISRAGEFGESAGGVENLNGIDIENPRYFLLNCFTFKAIKLSLKKNTVVTSRSLRELNYFIKANSRKLCKPSTSSRVSITVSNSPDPSRVYIRLCKHRNSFLLLK